MGVRPEDLDGPADATDNTIRITVSVLEQLGHTLLVYGYVDVWLDPAQPIVTLYLASDANGDILHPLPLPSHPSFLGLGLYAQFIVLEPSGCTPLDLSGSNSIHLTVLQ